MQQLSGSGHFVRFVRLSSERRTDPVRRRPGGFLPSMRRTEKRSKITAFRFTAVLSFILSGLMLTAACGSSPAPGPAREPAAGPGEKAEKPDEATPAEGGGARFDLPAPEPVRSTAPVGSEIRRPPKTGRDYFLLLPKNYFTVGCCGRSREKYRENYLTVEDTRNGYLEGAGDAAQNGFVRALFKRPDKTYIIGFNSFGEIEDSYYFLEYENGNWSDVSARVVPHYSRNNIYELPRFGTTTAVFAKKLIERVGKGEITERGPKLYDLKWLGGKFSIIR